MIRITKKLVFSQLVPLFVLALVATFVTVAGLSQTDVLREANASPAAGKVTGAKAASDEPSVVASKTIKRKLAKKRKKRPWLGGVQLPNPPAPTPAPTPPPTEPSEPPVPTPTQPPTPEPTPTPTPTDPPEPVTGWTQDLNESFDGIDQKIWDVRDGKANANEHSFLQAKNVSTAGGILRIQGKNESAGGRNYTSGYLDTNGKYSLPNYFRAEIRAKVPMEQGMWAAPLWLRPADFSGGEIDLLETYGKESARPKIHHTIHTDYGSGHEFSAKPAYYSVVDDATGTEWHTYVVEKRPGSITMWTDGVQTARWTQGDPSWFNQYYEANKRWELRVNLQIGGSWGGLPDATTDWSGDKTTMMVDYIRTWVPNQ